MIEKRVADFQSESHRRTVFVVSECGNRKLLDVGNLRLPNAVPLAQLQPFGCGAKKLARAGCCTITPGLPEFELVPHGSLNQGTKGLAASRGEFAGADHL